MSPSYDSSVHDPLLLLPVENAHLNLRGEAFWLKVGSYLATGVVIATIWFLRVAPDEKSPNKLMVEPAAELLSSFVQPAVNMQTLSEQIGFNVRIPNLKPIGADMKTVGEAEFGGRPAAVIQFEHNQAPYLLYTYTASEQPFADMRKVVAGGQEFFVTSGGDVSVVAWKDAGSCYHALAAKLSEDNLVRMAVEVDHT